jgi:uncharacterized repeat protein (TIGR01451 family)
LTYTFSITNNGPNTASSVEFTNVLPAGVTLLSASTSQGIAITDAAGVIADLGSLGLGTNAVVTVVAMPTAAAIPQGMTNASLTDSAAVASYLLDLNPYNNSAAVVSMVEQANPVLAILVDDARFGYRSNQFGFNLSGSAGQVVVVEGSTNLQDWVPLATNTLAVDPPCFSDPCCTNFAQRFYRLRTP